MFRGNNVMDFDVDGPICDIIHSIRNLKPITPLQKSIILSCSDKDKTLIIDTYNEILQYITNYIIEEVDIPNILGK